MKFTSQHIKKKEKSHIEYTAETFSLQMEAFKLPDLKNNFQIITFDWGTGKHFYSTSSTTIDKCRKDIEIKVRKYQQILKFLDKIDTEK